MDGKTVDCTVVESFPRTLNAIRFQSEDGDNAGCASNHDDMSEESSDIQGINCINDNLLVSSER